MSDPDELRAIGERLLMLAEGGALESFFFNELKPIGPDEAIDDRFLASIARSLYESRRLRDRHLQVDLFGEPAWDMLLELFACAIQGKRTAVTSLCIASGVPVTTALRWIGTLQDAGLVIREDSEQDRRVAYLKLSASGFTAIRGYLIEATRYLRPARNSFMMRERSE